MNADFSTPLLPDLPSERIAERKEQLLLEITREVPASSWTHAIKVRKPRVAFALAAGVAAAAAVAATATIGGSVSDPSAAVRQAGVNDVVAQAQTNFADGLIVSGTIDGSGLTVKLATPTSPSITVGGFEAAVVALVAADWMQAHGQAALATVRSVDVNGNPLAGATYGDAIDNSVAPVPLAADACQTAAQSAPASLTVVSARTLALAGGTCIFKLETSDPAAAAQAAPTTIPQVTTAIPDANAHPSLVEIDDQNGVPQVILTWVPGIAGKGQGQAYIRPGLPNTLSWG